MLDFLRRIDGNERLISLARKYQYRVMPLNKHPFGQDIPEAVENIGRQLIQFTGCRHPETSMLVFMGKIFQWSNETEYAKVIGLRCFEITGLDGEDYTLYEFHATSHVIISGEFNGLKSGKTAREQIKKLFSQLARIHRVSVEYIDLRGSNQFDIDSLYRRQKY